MKRNVTLLGMLLLLSATLFFSGCSDDEGTDPIDLSSEYILEVRSPDGATMAMHPVPDLTQGKAEIKNAFEVLFSWYVADWDRSGAVFGFDYNPYYFSKYELTTTFEMTEQIPLDDDYTPSANLRLDNDHVWFVKQIDGGTIHWAIINTTTMVMDDEGSFDLTVAEGKELGAGFAMKNGSNIIFGYREADAETGKDDVVKIAVLDATTYELESTDSDDRSSGSGNAYSQAAFRTEDGDVYFPTLTYAYAGNNPDKPCGFMRVKNNETTIDDTYFLNVKSKVNNNNLTGPLVYLGDDKVLAQVVREDLVENGDYWGVESDIYQNEWYVIDLSAETATKLDVPLSRGNGDGNPIMTADGLAAFVVNAANGNFIYTYNPTTGETKKGITYVGANVIYKLHNIE
ncbi:MAG TPA: DUF4374 domain-containing protein [Ohtaekwangia sp.]